MDKYIKRNRKIYTSSTFAKSNLVYLQEIGNLSVQSKYSSFRNSLNSYLLIYVSNGSGTLLVKKQQYSLDKGYFAVIDCKNGYTLSSNEEGWIIYWIHINGKIMADLYKFILDSIKKKPVFFIERLVNIKKIWQEIYDIAISNEKYKDLLINEQLLRLINLILKHSENNCSDTKNYRGKIDEIRIYLEENFNQSITLNKLSEIFFINKYYLTRAYKKTFKQTIHQTITQFRITKAKELLRYSTLSISEISMLCGFQDASYFSKVFKKIEGESPQKYKCDWKNDLQNNNELH